MGVISVRLSCNQNVDGTWTIIIADVPDSEILKLLETLKKKE